MNVIEKRGKRIDLNNLKNKISSALTNKKEIEKRVKLLNETFEKGEINYLEYKELLENFKDLNHSYSEYIDECQKQINGDSKNNFAKYLPATLVVLLLTFVLLLPVIQNGGITGLGFGIQQELPNATWSSGLPDFYRGSAVSGDLNDDGFVDLIVSGNGAGGVYLNNGTGFNIDSSWGSISSLELVSGALGDIDNDGDLDYLQMGQPNTVEVYLNNGSSLISDGNWVTGITSAFSYDKTSLALGDIDNDGDYDLVASGDDGGTYTTKVFLNTGSGFLYSTAWTNGLENVSDDDYGDRVLLGDFDKDCDLDLILFGKKSDGERIGFFYKNSGSGFVRDSSWESNLSRFASASATLGDIDNDGDLDLVVAGRSYSDDSDTCDTSITCAADQFCFFVGGSPGMDGICQCGGMPCNAGGFPPGQNDPNCNQQCCGSTGAPCVIATDCYKCVAGGQSCTSGSDIECWTEADKGLVYKNNGTALVESQTILALFGGAAVLGDADDNGLLDLFITGENNSNSPQMGFYINSGGTLNRNSTWEENISKYYQGVTALFSDFGNNSKLDLLVAGNLLNTTDWCNKTDQTCDTTDTCDTSDTCNMGSGLCNNNPLQPCGWDGDCYFCSANSDIPCPGGSNAECYVCSISGASCPSGTADDCDNYTCVYAETDCANTNSTCWYDYASTDIYINNISSTNSLPSVPNIFYSNYSNGKLILNWSGASDTETSAGGLYYNLRVGTTSGSNNVFSGYYSRSSNPTAGYFGNLMNKNFLNLSLGEAKYYWAVQTIDAALGASEWSTEQMYNFTQRCGNKDDDISLAENFTADQLVCFNITANDVTFDCNGYFIVGNGTGAAINVEGKTGIEIKNCNFINFTNDVVWENVNDSVIDGVDVIINITDSSGDNITGSDVDALYIKNSDNILIQDSLVKNYTLENVDYLAIENSSYGELLFLEAVNENGTNLFGNSTADIQWSNKELFVDSTGEPGFNVSANIFVYNVAYNWPRPYVNLSLNFTLCNSSTNPSCYNLSYTGGVFVFNTSHFTRYQIREGTLFFTNNTWSQNLPNVGLDGTVVLIDLNNDNRRDLHVTGYDVDLTQYYNEIYANDGTTFNLDGGLSSGLTGVAYSGSAWGDLDKDNDADLVYCGWTGATRVGEVWLNNNGSSMTKNVTNTNNIENVSYCSVVLGDYDIDGDLDLAMQGENNGFVSICNIYTNYDGTFYFNSTLSAGCSGKKYGSIKWVDLNNDSFVDLVSVGDDPFGNGVIEILINDNGSSLNKNLTWVGGLENQSKAALSYADLNNDGLRDLVVHGNTSANGPKTYWYQNNGNGFTEITNHDMKNVSHGDICIADFDADGYRDVYMAGSDETLGINGVYHADIYLNQNGTGLFRDEAYSRNLTGLTWSSCSIADIDNGSSDPEVVAIGSIVDGLLNEHTTTEVTTNKGGGNLDPVIGDGLNDVEVQEDGTISNKRKSDRKGGDEDDSGIEISASIRTQGKDGAGNFVTYTFDQERPIATSGNTEEMDIAYSGENLFRLDDPYDVSFTSMIIDPSLGASGFGPYSGWETIAISFVDDNLGSGTIYGIDCTLSSDNRTIKGEAMCTGNASILPLRVVVQANAPTFNYSVHWANATGTTGWLSNQSHQWVGNTTNQTSLGLGSTIFLTDYTNNTNATPILAIANVTGNNNYVNITTQLGLNIYVLESQGTKTGYVRAAFTANS